MPDIESETSTELKDLEEKLDKLIEKYKLVKSENSSLKTKQDSLVKEKAKLLEKTTIARTRVEAMITRLKSMEHGS
ncbi:MAG: TIGR02449 family protein [Methylococcales bacterium]